MTTTAALAATDATVVALTHAITDGAHTVARAVAVPSWQPWLTFAGIIATALAAAFAGWAANEARRSVEAAAQGNALTREGLAAAADANALAERGVEAAAAANALAQVRDFVSEYEQKHYFIRFWTLSMATRDLTGVGYLDTKLQILDPDAPHVICVVAKLDGDYPEAIRQAARDLLVQLVKETRSSQLLRDALGPSWSAERADMFGVYYFALKLASFCGLDESDEANKHNVRLLNANFGVQLTGTLMRHRRLAARFVNGVDMEEYNFEHYRINYGLRDDIYTRLVDALSLDAHKTGLLTDAHRREIAMTETYLSQHPKGDPMRKIPFDRPQ